MTITDILHSLETTLIQIMPSEINVIDLFAGPGGLGEGFSAFTNKGNFPYQIKVSIEKEPSAHKTLTLRSFVRKFRGGNIPDEYYEYLRNPDLNTSYLAGKYPKEWNQAIVETMGRPMELGTDDDEEIFRYLAKLKNENSNPFVVIGGPPCQAYSVVGRIKNNSIDGYKAEEDPRHFLYKEYLKVLDAINPDVFVMENVRGILTAKVKDERIFPLILDDLKCPAKALGKQKGRKYAIFSLSTLPSDSESDGQPIYKSGHDFVIKSEKYGVPQTRHRVILLGVRLDVLENGTPDILKSSPSVFTDHVLDGMPRIRSSVSRQKDCKELWKETIKEEAESLVEILNGNGQCELAARVRKIAENLSIPQKQTGDKRFVEFSNAALAAMPYSLKKFIGDKRLNGHLNHFARSHMPSDLQRYLFCAVFAEVNKKRKIPSPIKNDFPEELAPNHASWESGKFADRFRVQFKGRASSTITSHINRDGHYFIHYDPTQCRSLSVREAARLQTFPDNYFFEGNQTQQFIQVGNAVPPYLAYKISQIVYNILSA